ncbi:MAG TPA: RNA polymerase sigma factor [Firmicutes bacterium]|nr:RNA polymerase sigma factor [Bacillota bacterium]
MRKGIIRLDPLINLIRRCKNNEKEAFNDLLARHEHYLFKLCYGLTRDRDEALDIMQETYIFRNIHRFDENRPFLPWLRKIAINSCLNYRQDLPGTKLLNRTLSHLGKSAQDSFRRRNPLLSRIIFG